MPYSEKNTYFTLRILALLLIIGASGVVPITYFHSQTLLVHSSGQILALAAADTATKLDSLFAYRRSDVETLADLLADHVDDMAFVQRQAHNIAKHYPIYAWVGIVDAGGRIIAASGRVDVVGTQAGTPWFTEIQESRQTRFRDAEPTGFLEGNPLTVALSSPILDRQGNFLGAVSIRIRVAAIETLVTNTIQRLRSQYPLIDAIEYQFLTPDGTPFIDSTRDPMGTVNLKRMGVRSALLEVHAPGYLQESHVRRHVDVITGYAETYPLATGGHAGWRILMRLDKPVILARSRDYLMWFVGPTTAVSLCLLTALLWCVRRLYTAWALAQAESIRARRAETARGESEARARAILENTLDAVVVMSAEGRVLEWNGNAELLFGWAREEAVGQDCASLIIPLRHRERHCAGLRRFLAGGPSAILNRRIDTTALHRDGHEIPVELSVTLVVQDGKPCFSAFLRDISAQVQSRAALREAKDRAEISAAEKALIINTVDSFFVRLDRHGLIREWTPAAERILGIGADAVCGRSFSSLALTWQPEAHDIHTCFLSGGGFSTCSHERIRLSRPDGTSVLIRMAIKLIQTDQCDGLVLMGEDVTERERLQQEMGRTQKWEAIGQLAAGIAHEVNTPTQYIMDNTKFLSDGFSNLLPVIANHKQLVALAGTGGLTTDAVARSRQMLESVDVDFLLAEIPPAIRQSIEGLSRVSAIVRAMKEFAHPDSPEPSTADINHCIRSTVEIARNEWKYDVDMQLDLCSDLPSIQCFPNEFNQVILNLIINGVHAIQAKGEGQPGVIRITTRLHQDAVEVRVSDSGTGIPLSLQDRIFDPFFTTKDVGKGTGQGLSIARSVIVNKHQGTISFETAEGMGTTFIIRLPCAMTMRPAA